MKRITTTLLLLLLIILTTNLVVAADLKDPDGKPKPVYEPTYSPCTSSTLTTCDTTLDSISGNGAVELCGVCHVCGEDDGICPEDFYSDGLQGSCASCPDPDCTGTIEATVSSGGSRISGATISIKYEGSNWQPLGLTNYNGELSRTAKTGANILAKADAEYVNGEGETVFYTSTEKTIPLLERGETESLTFGLTITECESDCTYISGFTCIPSCHGTNGCLFPSDLTYTVEQTQSALTGINLGSYGVLEESISYDCDNGNMTQTKVSACEGPFITETLIMSPELFEQKCGGNGTGSNCSNGVRDGDEKGVDCGGTICPACENCTDGILNQDETATDCGGTICPACTGNCFDGIKNNGETGKDCGGPCDECPGTCEDGEINQDETGIDCGGTICPACTGNCFDGIKNNGETGKDCGGPCDECTTPTPTPVQTYQLIQEEEQVNLVTKSIRVFVEDEYGNTEMRILNIVYWEGEDN